MCRRLCFLLTLALILGAASSSYGIVVGDFEDAGLDGWWSDDATLSQSATGATVGSSAMQADVPGTSKKAAMMDAVPHMATMALEGAVISADLTVSAFDGSWSDVEIVVNAQNNNDNGANNNVDWNSLGVRGLVSDGTTNSYSWTIDSTLAGKIAAADSGIQWFEVVIVTDNDANSLSLNVDNVQINEPPTDVVIGNFEDAGLDGWYAGATLSQGAVGVTLDSSSMKIVAPSDWQTVSILDAHPWITLMGTGVKISADITVIDTDLVGSDWLQAEMVVNGENNGEEYLVGWNELGFQDLVRDGQPHTHTWDISPALTAAIVAADQGIGWFEIFFVTNMDAAGTGVTLYVDNIRLFQPEPTGCEGPPGIVVGDFEIDVDGWWTAVDDSTITQGATGASTGTGALQIEDAGGWKIGARLDAKPYISLLGAAGAQVTMDVTVFAAEQPEGWFNVGLVINGEDNGTTYTIGWRDMGQQGVALDGLPQKVTFDLPADLIADIAQIDTNIGWFELMIIKNGGAGASKLYVDNVRISQPEPVSYPYGFLLGDFETGLDGWLQWDATTFEQSEIGVTRGCNALKIEAPGGYHGDMAINASPYYDMFAAGAIITADITAFAEDFVGFNWAEVFFLINSENQGWRPFSLLPLILDGMPHTYTWEIDEDLRAEIASETGGSWFELVFLTNTDNDTAPVVYIDNIWIYLDAKATNPSPADGATDVECLITASWMSGDGAVEHDVFLSTNQTALSEVNRDNLASYPDVIYFNTPDPYVDFPKLDLSTLYSWRVDEVEDSNNIVTGNIWRFTVANSILIDNFESYLDSADLFATWVDSNSLSTDVSNLGDQAMLLTADNTRSPFYTETTVSLSEGFTDLTQSGMAALELYFHGDPNNSPESLYVRVVNSANDVGVVVYPGDPQDIALEQWQVWRIVLGDFGIDLTDVATVSIGFGNRENPSAGGKIYDAYIDDIRLIQRECILSGRTAAFAALDYAPAGDPAGDCVIDGQELAIMVNDWLMADEFIAATDPGTSGLVAYYPLDGDPNDASGSGHVGTIMGSVQWVPGLGASQAAEFDGQGGGYIDLGTWDPSETTGELSIVAWIKWNGLNGGYQGVLSKRDGWNSTDTMWQIELNNNTGNIGFLREGSYPWFGDYNIPFEGEWMHVAVTFDGTTATMYIRGKFVASSTDFSFGPKTDAQITIGSVDFGSNSFNGAIDEVYIYSRALSAAEVAHLADATPGDGELYYSLTSDAELYDAEAAGSRSINLRDFAVLAGGWLSEQMWP